MDKLKLHSKDITAENIEKLAALFPNCLTESKAEDGSIKHAIDFDLLRQELSADLVEGPQERYRLDWPGKREALATANAPIARTLRPCPAESKDFDSTKNLYVEGDNLEALKLLQETYLNKVKMIYIDPPYNTGTDFVYADNYSEGSAEYSLRSNQSDAAGNRLVANTNTNGRFHSDWLSMILPRIKLSRNLLADDGLIFVSIDDNEAANLVRIMMEIFGDDNFVATFIWEKRTNRENRKAVSYRHDTIVCFRKNNTGNKALYQLPLSERALSNYKNLDDDHRGRWKSDPAHAQAGHATKHQFYDLEAPSGKIHTLESGRCWVYTKDAMAKQIADGRIWFGKSGTGVPRIKTYLNEKERGLTPESILFANEASTNESAKNALKQLFDGKAVFETPKPVELLTILLRISTKNSDLVLDFFSGSAALAEATMRLNLKDQGSRKHVSVQIAEPCEKDSEASKAGYKTIAEIGKERIRRAGAKIRAELEAQLEGELPGTPKHQEITAKLANLDTGFRVLKVDSSNMADVYYRPDEVIQDGLPLQVENVKPDRTPEDLLFQVLLDWGVDLALPIEQTTIAGKTVFFVDENKDVPDHHPQLAACFDSGLDEDFVKELAKRKPLRAVFRDASYASDATKINIEQIFKALSAHTELRSI